MSGSGDAVVSGEGGSHEGETLGLRLLSNAVPNHDGFTRHDLEHEAGHLFLGFERAEYLHADRR